MRNHVTISSDVQQRGKAERFSPLFCIVVIVSISALSYWFVLAEFERVLHLFTIH